MPEHTADPPFLRPSVYLLVWLSSAAIYWADPLCARTRRPLGRTHWCARMHPASFLVEPVWPAAGLRHQLEHL